MSKLKDDIIKGTAMPVSTLLIESAMNDLFMKPRHGSETRRGLHASAIITSENSFCIREQVLSLFFERNQHEANHPVGLLRIFEEGNCVHEKWQNLFVNNGIAVGIEDRAYSAFFDLYMTPDAIIMLNGKQYVVEIKSCNTFSYKHMVDKHPSGTKQLQLYMHFLCIPRGFVLAEDKNTQEFKIFETEYEPGQAKPYIERLFKIRDGKRRFEREGKLPPRCCSKPGIKRAQGCPFSGACFGTYRKYLPEWEE